MHLGDGGAHGFSRRGQELRRCLGFRLGRRGCVGSRSLGLAGQRLRVLDLGPEDRARNDKRPLLRLEGRLELCRRGGVGLELLEVGLQVHLLELRQDEVEGAALAEYDRRVAVEAHIVLDGLG